MDEIYSDKYSYCVNESYYKNYDYNYDWYEEECERKLGYGGYCYCYVCNQKIEERIHRDKIIRQKKQKKILKAIEL